MFDKCHSSIGHTMKHHSILAPDPQHRCMGLWGQKDLACHSTEVICALERPPWKVNRMAIAKKSTHPVGWSWPPPSSKLFQRTVTFLQKKYSNGSREGQMTIGPMFLVPSVPDIWVCTVMCEFEAAIRLLFTKAQLQIF